jgi:YVTN family beta-propeller protein
MISRRQFLGPAVVLAACGRRRATGFPGFAFVANQGERSVAAVNLTRFRVTQQIRLDGAPSALTAHPARRRLYVLVPQKGTICEINPATMSVERKLSLGGVATGMRLSPDSRVLWVLTRSPNALVSVPIDKFAAAARIRLPGAPEDFDLSSRGDLAAVTIPDAAAAVFIDMEKAAVERVVPAGGDPRLIRFRFDGRQVLVANRSERQLTILDVPEGRTLVKLPLPVEPAHFCFKSDGGQLFVTGKGMDAVVVVHPYQTEVSETRLAGKAPGAMGISSDYLFIANPESGDVTILEIATRNVVAGVMVGQEPSYVAITPDDQYALVVNRRSGDLAVIRIGAIGQRQRQNKNAPLFTMIPVGSEPVCAEVQAV